MKRIIGLLACLVCLSTWGAKPEVLRQTLTTNAMALGAAGQLLTSSGGVGGPTWTTVAGGDVFKALPNIFTASNQFNAGVSANVAVITNLIAGNGLLSVSNNGFLNAAQSLIIDNITRFREVGVVPGAAGEPSLLYDTGSQYFPGSTVYKLWADNMAGTGISYSESLDGLTWTGGATVITAAIHEGTCVKIGTSYHWYGAETGQTNIVHYASPDGWSGWTLVGAPIVIDVLPGWKNLALANAGVLQDGTNTIMLFDGYGSYSHYWDHGAMWAVGLATSGDGTNWTEYAGNPVLVSSNYQVTSCRLFKVGTNYYAPNNIGSGRSVLPSEISMFTSWNLTNWSKLKNGWPFIVRSSPLEGPFNDDLLLGSQVADAFFIDIGGTNTAAFYSINAGQASASYLVEAISGVALTNLVSQWQPTYNILNGPTRISQNNDGRGLEINTNSAGSVDAQSDIPWFFHRDVTVDKGSQFVGIHNVPTNLSYNYGGSPVITGQPAKNDFYFAGAGNFLDISVGYNYGVGMNALHFNVGGYYNEAFGNSSLFGNYNGSENAAYGRLTLGDNSDGNQNSAFGNNAGYNLLATLDHLQASTFLGYDAHASQNVTNSTAVGFNSVVTRNNETVIGNSSNAYVILNGTVGVGTLTPTLGLVQLTKTGGNDVTLALEQFGVSSWRLRNVATSGNFGIYDGALGVDVVTIDKATGNFGIKTNNATSCLSVQGPIATAITTGGAVTLGATHSTYLVNQNGVTVTLPSAVGIQGRQYVIKTIHPCALLSVTNATGAERIDGALNVTISATNQVVVVQSDNANWWVINKP